MLVGYRNNILLIGLLLTLLFLIMIVVFAYHILSTQFDLAGVTLLKANTWWFTYKPVTDQGTILLWGFISIFAILTVNLISGFVLRLLFRKTASPELFFFTIFLLSFSFESFRILNIFFQHYNISPHLTLLNSKIVYFGRIFGILSLLCSSLFAVEIKYQKFDIMLGISASLAIFIAYLIPMDSSILLSHFLFRLGDEGAIFLLTFSFAFFILLNFLIASFRRQGRFFYLVAATLIVLIGRELLFFMSTPAVTVFGIIMILMGTIIFSRQIDKIYLWS